MFTLLNVLFAFVMVGILLLVARFIKHKIRLFQTLYLPESIIAGAIALILGPGVLGAIAFATGTSPDSYFAGGLFPEEMQTIWFQSPGIFINIVFAALFLGETIANPQDIWRKTAPKVAFGQSLAWGRYTLGIILVMLVLTPVFGVNPIAAPALIAQFGSIAILFLTTGLLAFWLIFGIVNCQRTKKQMLSEQAETTPPATVVR